MLAPKLTALSTLVPEGAYETLVLAGLFLVTSGCVADGVKFAVDQVTDELQVDALTAMVQEVAEILPEGPDVTVTSCHGLQLLLEFDSTIGPMLLRSLWFAQARTERVPAAVKVIEEVAVSLEPAKRPGIVLKGKSVTEAPPVEVVAASAFDFWKKLGKEVLVAVVPTFLITEEYVVGTLAVATIGVVGSAMRSG